MKSERRTSSSSTVTLTRVPTPTKVTGLLLTLLLFFITGTVSGVNVTSPSQAVKGTAGREALLSVSYSSRSADQPVIKWQLKREREKPITVVQSIGTSIIGNLRPEYRNRILVFENGSLLLHHLQLSDEGSYEVEISITDDSFTGEHSVELSVDVPVSKPYVQMMASSVLEYSEYFHIHCFHSNGTKPAYAWLKGGKLLANDSRLLLSHDQKVLTIARVLMSDDDVYACTVDNPISSMKSAPVHLTVYRRSSLYIILSTGGIFLLITLVTVCACWKPSKKKNRPVPPPRAPVYVEQIDNGHDVDVVPKPTTLGRRSPMPLYVLNEDETMERYEDRPSSPVAVSQSEILSSHHPASYNTVPHPPLHHHHSSSSGGGGPLDRPVWTTPRRYNRSPLPSPLAHPLPLRPPAPPMRPLRSPVQLSPGGGGGSSSPHQHGFTPIRKYRPPVGIPTSHHHLPVVEAASEGPELIDHHQRHSPLPQ